MFHCTQFPFSIFKLKKEGMAQDFCTVLYNIPLYFDNPWLIKNKKKAVVYCRNNNRRQIILQKVCVVFGVARLFCDLQTLWGPGPPLATSYLCSWSLAQSATDFRSQQTRANYKKSKYFCYINLYYIQILNLNIFLSTSSYLTCSPVTQSTQGAKCAKNSGMGL